MLDKTILVILIGGLPTMTTFEDYISLGYMALRKETQSWKYWIIERYTLKKATLKRQTSFHVWFQIIGLQVQMKQMVAHVMKVQIWCRRQDLRFGTWQPFQILVKMFIFYMVASLVSVLWSGPLFSKLANIPSIIRFCSFFFSVYRWCVLVL